MIVVLPQASRRPVVASGTAVTAVTEDGVVISGIHLPPTSARRPRRAGAGPPSMPAFVIAHGFTNDTSSRTTHRLIAGFARFGAVVAFDFRGHGRSGGRTSVGRDETADLDAAVGFARGLGYRKVAVVGFSLGAAVAIRHAAIGRHRPDAVVAISAPSRWYIRHTGPMRRVHWLLESPLGHAAGRALGVRIGGPWAEVPSTPLELAARVAPLPFLLVHGTADAYFGTAESVALQVAAGSGAQLWIEPGMGHAESGASPDLVRRIAAWVAAALD
jgi:pimeloyl-ACP methyl ester carboxylesterase